MKFDLEERTFNFAKEVRKLISSIKSPRFIEDTKQLIRSSGSVAANYIEANEAISSKDFLVRIKICRKEAKESYMWLKLIRNNVQDSQTISSIEALADESLQLCRIFGAIIFKCESNKLDD
jgi:four helix bundle protein